jgi:S1-C subfamily serine protease
MKRRAFFWTLTLFLASDLCFASTLGRVADATIPGAGTLALPVLDAALRDITACQGPFETPADGGDGRVFPQSLHRLDAGLHPSEGQPQIRDASKELFDAASQNERSSLLEYEANTADVYDKILPSAVSIESVAPGETESHGSASGFIWDRKGHVITNNHVIEGLKNHAIYAVLHDGTRLRAEIVGGYARGDIGVLKVSYDPEKLHPVVPGDSDKLRVGQKAVAIGNPLGLTHSLALGVVSGLHRAMPDSLQGPPGGAVQTDAVFAHGSSGGLLLDSAARLIGMTSYQIGFNPRMSYGMGLGLAIPVNLIKDIVPRIIRGESVAHPSLGLTFAPEEVRGQLMNGFPVDGVVVWEVKPGSDAQRAGLRGMEGLSRLLGGRGAYPDIITAIDGQPVKNSKALYDLLDRRRIGDSVELAIYRNGKTLTRRILLSPDS